MSQTNTRGQCASPTPVPFNEDAWNAQAHVLQQSLPSVALPTVLQGVFTILCAASMYALTRATFGKRPSSSSSFRGPFSLQVSHAARMIRSEGFVNSLGRAPSLRLARAADSEAGFLYARFLYGLAGSALSFGTNLWATVLVGYKALVSRRFVRKHRVIAGSLGLQTKRVPSLLVGRESGAFYCAVWAAVVVWHIASDYAAADANAAGNNGSFWAVYGAVISGALVPIIAIYPTVIIILVALNRSQIEQRFECGDGWHGPDGPGPVRMPLRTLTVTIGSVADSMSSSSDSLMDRKLVLYAITTGLLTSAFMLVFAVSAITRPNDMIYLALSFVTAKLYTNTLLATLNTRKSLREAAINPSRGVEVFGFSGGAANPNENENDAQARSGICMATRLRLSSPPCVPRNMKVSK
ncbi:hypothetical protein LXA43DRAFT_1095270 [Ganoderma leucocontextum]|nr:hypothetical protein LXA43DRAFT_1095270 [Ganoderma leucocontextum]